MDTNIQSEPRPMHPFERAGLGKAPFRFVGLTSSDLLFGERILNRAEYERTGVALTTKPGGTCAYCGTYIVNMCNVVSADGRRFHVGTDCVAKVGDAKLSAPVDEAKRARIRARRVAKAAAEMRALEEAIAPDSMRARLAALPHPIKWRADKGETLLAWVEWMRAAGAAGRAKALKTVLAVGAAE